MKKPTKAIALILSTLILLSVFTAAVGTSAFAADNYKVSAVSEHELFSDTAKCYAKGDEFDLNLFIRAHEPLLSGTIYVKFDPDSLFAVSASKGDAMTSGATFIAAGVNKAEYQNSNKMITITFSSIFEASDYTTESLLFTAHFKVKDSISAEQDIDLDIANLDGIIDPYDLNSQFAYIDNNTIVNNNISARVELTGGVEPATTAAPTTEAPTTLPPTTAPPTTTPPTTAPVTTDPPATEPVTTAPPTTAPPTTAPPTTTPPTTARTTTAPPTTTPPTTARITTAPPTTTPPTTTPPTTARITTAPPTTTPPTTARITTAPPTTTPPTTARITTAPPTTARQTTAPPTTAVPTTTAPSKRVITFANNQKWSAVNLYAWTNGGSAMSGWPGTAMIKTGKQNSYNEDLYELEIDTKYDRIIFNNGSEQTVDITVNPNASGYYLTTKDGNKWEAAVWIDGQNSTTAPQSEKYTFYYLPSSAQENSGYTYKLNYNDVNGTAPEYWHQYTFEKTDIVIGGVHLYSISFSKHHDSVNELQYQVYNGSKWVSQIKFSNVKLSDYNEKVVKYDGTTGTVSPTEAPTTVPPTTAPPTTVPPTTAPPTTVPPTTAPPTTVPPTTAPPTTVPPTTAPPTTVPPTTAPPITVPPTTAPPTTVPPTTAPPTTVPPTTAPPTTVPPTTAPPTTAPPTTVPPTTAPPTTAPPTTAPPTTAPPTSAPPTTAPPTTAPPTTAPPTSAPPTTAPPTTAPPTTAPPTSAPPTTVPPTTQAPTTTAPPTTEAPTTEAPTTKPEMYTFYYQPSIDQEAAGFTYKFSYNDLYGVNPQNWHEYTFTRTLIRLNGIYIYSVSVPKQYDRVRKILYQVYDDDTWVSQIEFSSVTLSYYNNMVVKSDGSIKPENTTRPPTEEEFTTAPPSTTATEQSTTEPVENTTAPVEETTAEATSPTEATEETTAQAIEETTQDIQPTTDEPEVTSSPFTATKVFYYLPSTQQAVAGYSYKLTVQDNKGEFELYDFHASDIFVNGARVYTAEIPADIEITVLYFQVYDFEKWISQISVSPDIAEGNIIKSDGEVYKDEPETTIEPTSQEPATETQLITEQPTTIAPTEVTTSAVINKKANPIKVSAKKKTIKANKLIKKAQKIKPLKVKNYKGKLTYKLIKKGSYKKLFKKAKINSKGVISIKKLKIKKGTYKLKVSVTAKGNKDYKAKKVTKVLKIKIT